MTAKSYKFIGVNLEESDLKRVNKLARAEERKTGPMLRILVHEALEAREVKGA